METNEQSAEKLTEKYREGGKICSSSGMIYSKSDLLSYLTEVKEAVKNCRRDTTILQVAHLNVLITGGMTWGDDPTETYTAISNLNEFDGILSAVGFYQDDIPYKEILLKVLKTKGIALLLLGVDDVLDKMIQDKLRRA